MEVYYNGEWGAVCYSGWDQQDANVVCRQLGFESAIIVDFGQRPAADITLENVACSSNDRILASCGHYGVGITVNCRSLYKVAAVKCQGTPLLAVCCMNVQLYMYFRSNNTTRNYAN